MLRVDDIDADTAELLSPGMHNLIAASAQVTELGDDSEKEAVH
jgi:hypothetical protein